MRATKEAALLEFLAATLGVCGFILLFLPYSLSAGVSAYLVPSL